MVEILRRPHDNLVEGGGEGAKGLDGEDVLVSGGAIYFVLQEGFHGVHIY